jgi:predicted methyltransferase
MRRARALAAVVLAAAALASGCSAYTPQKIVRAEDRSPEDRVLDIGRRPEELLGFLDLKPGMRVAELGAGGGYTTELLARAVGPTGVVYAQNRRFILERYAAKPWGERLAKPVMQNVVRVDRDFDDPLPPEAHDLDRVVIVLIYHDTVWMDVDRISMNEAVMRALKPGGLYVVVDHSARKGDGYDQVRNLHRIEESMLRAEIESTGFVLVREGDFLRNPADARDWNDSPGSAGERRGMSDRFVLAFEKPTKAVSAR